MTIDNYSGDVFHPVIELVKSEWNSLHLELAPAMRSTKDEILLCEAAMSIQIHMKDDWIRLLVDTVSRDKNTDNQFIQLLKKFNLTTVYKDINTPEVLSPIAKKYSTIKTSWSGSQPGRL